MLGYSSGDSVVDVIVQKKINFSVLNVLYVILTNYTEFRKDEKQFLKRHSIIDLRVLLDDAHWYTNNTNEQKK